MRDGTPTWFWIGMVLVSLAVCIVLLSAGCASRDRDGWTTAEGAATAEALRRTVAP